MRKLLVTTEGRINRAAVIDGPDAIAFTVFTDAPVLTGGLYRARVSRLAPEADGAFLELPDGAQAFLPLAQAHSLCRGPGAAKGIADCVAEGAAVTVAIIEEARPEDAKLAVASARIPKGDRRLGKGAEPPAVLRPSPGIGDQLALWARQFDVRAAFADDADLGQALGAAEDWPVTLYSGTRPLFDDHGISDQWAAALEPIVPLPSGGRLTIEETRAGVMIDVDTGRAPGGATPHTARRRTNMEAAMAIPRELILRNLSGLIIADFIDPRVPAERNVILATLDAGLADDPLPVRRTGFSKFGVIELSRRRQGLSLAGGWRAASRYKRKGNGANE